MAINGMRIAMAAPVPLREDYDAAELRRLARSSSDPGQVRRLLAVAAIYAGEARGERLVAASAEFLLHLAELGAHSVAAGLPLEQEGAPSTAAADEREAQEGEGLRLAEPALRAPRRRVAAELEQAGLVRMELKRELP